jgi:hypothetical protein
MKARGVAFAIEAIATLALPEEQKTSVFARLEKVVLTKMDEFIPHYLVKILVSYAQAGHGSGELFDSLITQIIKALG